MRKAGLWCILLLVLSSCQKDNFLRFSNSPRALGLLPDVPEAGLRFFSSEGDTVELKKLSSANSFLRGLPLSGDIGGTDNLDYVELENNRLVIGADTPYFRFTYSISSEQSPIEARGAFDRFALSWEDENGPADSELLLSISDTIVCENEACAYADTLSFSGETSVFLSLYYTPRSNAGDTRLFINSNNGLVAFTTANNLTFERIP